MVLRNVLKILPMRRFRDPPPTVGVVRMAGILTPGGRSLRRGGLNLEGMARTLERAFKLPNAQAVALVINSPGGSPVQSSLIAKRVRTLAEEKDIPVYAFTEDVAASGGYWLACAADEIYADEASVVGSIGVISASFGFQDLIARHGIERRLHTTGDRKTLLDPFEAEKPADVQRLESVQRDILDAFKAQVTARRGDRILLSEAELFSGEFWTGKQALAHGLIDGIGDLRAVMRDKLGERVKLVPVGERRPWLGRRFGFGTGGNHYDLTALSSGLVEAAVDAIDERAIWKQFGL
ncbi:MAG: S49 family peptidase [Alphaproteobacteria bacterium]|nr:S49 family peptidase [Alphaproteobacteria bacterium]